MNSMKIKLILVYNTLGKIVIKLTKETNAKIFPEYRENLQFFESAPEVIIIVFFVTLTILERGSCSSAYLDK